MMARLVLADAFRLGVLVVLAAACSEPDPGNQPAASAPVSVAPAPASRSLPLSREEDARACTGEAGGVPRHLTASAASALDPARAVACMRWFCAHEHWESCDGLGSAHLSGRGVGQDRAQAQALFEAACARGHQPACTHLGVLLLGDAPTAPDAAAVFPLFQRACDANDGEGCFQLATLYAAGLGIATKADVAAALFDRACDGGEPRACSSLARLLDEGRPGVPRDPARARSYRERACRSGHAPSCEALDAPAR